MANTISATMATQIALDTVGATKSLRSLTLAVNATNNAWRAQESSLRSAGEYLQAAEARYKGLGSTIDAQKNKITELKSKQSDLNVETKDGATQYLKYQDQISKAQSKLDGLTAQQNKAKQAVDLQKSGVIELNNQLRNSENVTNSYVQRLKAEGDEMGALKTKRDSLVSQQSKMSESYRAETRLLEDLKNAENQDGDAIAKQTIRVNNLGTKMAETKTKIGELNTEMKTGPNISWGQRLKNNLLGVDEATDKTNKHMGILKGTMIGSFVGNAVYSGISRIGSGLLSAAKNGLELAEQGEQTERVWKDMGVNSKGIEILSGSMVKLRNESGYSAGTIKQLQKSLYGVTGSAKDTSKVTTALVAMGVASGTTEEKVGGLARSMSRMFTSDKVTTTQLARVETQIPKLGSALAKAAGVSQSAFNKMVSSGKISGKEFQDLIEKVSKQSPEMFKNFGKTGEGAMAQIKGQWTSLKSNMMAPLVTVKGSGLVDLEKAMASKEMTQASKDIGKGLAGMAKSLASFVDYGARHSKDILGIASAIGAITKALLIGAWKTASTIIMDFGKAFGVFSKNSKAAKDPLQAVDNGLTGLAKHQGAIKAIGSTLVGLFVGSKVLGGMAAMTKGIYGFSAGLKTVHAAKTMADLKNLDKLSPMAKKLGSIKIGAKWVGGKAVSAAKLSFKGLSKVGSAIKISAQWLGGKAVAAGKLAIGGLAKAGRGVGKALVWTAKIGWKGAQLAFSGIIRGIALVGTAFKALGAVMIANPFIAITAAVVAVGVAFYELYKHSKKFRQFVNGMVKTAANFAESIGKWFSKAWSGITKGLSKAWKSVSRTFSKGWKGLQKGASSGVKKVGKAWNSMKSVVGKATSKVWKSVQKTNSKQWKNYAKWTKSGIKTAGKAWNSLRTTVSKTTSRLWKATKKATSKGWKTMSKTTKSFAKRVSDNWDDMRDNTYQSIRGMMKENPKIMKNGHKTMQNATKTWKDFTSGKWSDLRKDTKNTTSALVKTAKSLFSGMYSKLNSMTNGGLSKMLKSFKTTFGGIETASKNVVKHVKSFFSGMWGDLKSIGGKGINAIIGVLNGGIGGIDTVISSFGGSKSAIGKIKKVAYASGTGRRPITEPTLAMLNDGYDSPDTGNREIGMLPNGRMFSPKERNWTGIVPAGTEIFNATESKMLASVAGLTHFASGTGIWDKITDVVSKTVKGAVGFAKNAFSGLKNLFTTATKIVKNPTGFLTGMFNQPTGKSPVMKAFASGFYNKTVPSAKNWWSTLWKMVNLNGGAGGDWALPKGLQKKDGFGSSRASMYGAGAVHDGVDYSGPMGSAIDAVHGGTVIRVGGVGIPDLGDVVITRSSDGYDVIYQEFGNMSNVKVKKGDTVKTGDEVATLGHLNGAGNGSHVHIGVTKGNPLTKNMLSTSGWYDVSKMAGKTTSSDSDSSGVDAKTPLQKMIKKQVGSGFWKMISKLASMFGDDAGGDMANPGGSGVMRWKNAVIKALKANGFSASDYQVNSWLKVIARESHGDPRAKNNWDSNAQRGTPSEGLVQTIGPTFNAFKFKGHGNIYNGYDDLLAGINYMKHIYGKGNSAFARVSGSEGYANGGLVTKEQLAPIAEGNKPEMVIPLDKMKRSRAWSLVGDVVNRFTRDESTTNNNVDSTQLDEMNAKFDKLLSMFGKLLGVNISQIDAIKKSAFDKTTLYKQQARDQTMRDIQTL
ncbi:peptidoglycan DD-metalloendopeptidase family protein [Lactobacillus sp. LC28-10]|uniref:Peptidoglycan DD-metalloendopeptidase family protein n=1 Tax=Secundilactobacillus angelensis TaxID=2722706 RepID=A0ABX1KXF1_9LACO|nr:tape measure protein [Secundilactobacillus angelensis]MCH5461499.1 tape measure protein [Secundilactobacillus angelensis]NLR17688.1 peptidoglycan DD-metalloendopeptidase family protein [Secundilactobacillus angelensis]